MKQLGPAVGSESLGSAYAEAGGDRVGKKTLLTSAGGTTGIIHAQNQKKKSTVDCHEINPQKESRLSHSLPQHGTEFRERD